MFNSVEGIYQNGKIELLETPDLLEGTKVIVTFLPNKTSLDLSSRGINPQQAANLRARLQSFAQDWEHPDMDAYDAL
jgi:predicted DNA-binding antitoxin AbrB/MazE fold protein